MVTVLKAEIKLANTRFGMDEDPTYSRSARMQQGPPS